MVISMVHQIEFHNDDLNTRSFDDYKMILKRKQIGMPKPRIKKILIPGRDGYLDVSKNIDGMMHYDDRKLTFEFTIIDTADWESTMTKIANDLHGVELYIVLWDEPNHRYYGTCMINEFKSSKMTKTLSIDVACEPFKYTEKVKHIEYSGSSKTTTWYIVDSKDVQEKITIYNRTNDKITIAINGREYTVYGNSKIYPPKQLKVGPYPENGNEIKITTTGGSISVDIIYWGGDI